MLDNFETNNKVSNPKGHCFIVLISRLIITPVNKDAVGHRPRLRDVSGSHRLKVSYCDCWMSVLCHPLSGVCRQQLLQRTSPKLLAGFCPNITGMIREWPSSDSVIVQMVPVHCLFR